MACNLILQFDSVRAHFISCQFNPKQSSRTTVNAPDLRQSDEPDFFYKKTGLYFTCISDGLHPKSYKNVPKRNKNYIQVLERNSRSSMSPMVGAVAMKPATFPTQECQSF